MPDLLGDLRRVAHRHRPGRGRIEDQRAFAGNQELVVRRIVPGKRVLREKRHQPLEPLKHLLGGVGIDGDVAFLVDQRRAVAAKHRINPRHRIVCDSERQAKCVPSLGTFFRSAEECVPGPLFGQCCIRRRASRIHFCYVEIDELLEQIDPSGRG